MFFFIKDNSFEPHFLGTTYLYLSYLLSQIESQTTSRSFFLSFFFLFIYYYFMSNKGSLFHSEDFVLFFSYKKLGRKDIWIQVFFTGRTR